MEKNLNLSACADYHQRNPKESLLYNIFSKGLSKFLSTVDNDPNKKALPQYVTNELEAFLKCRIPEESGFSRWRCDGVCGHEIFVAHSCKKRGLRLKPQLITQNNPLDCFATAVPALSF